MWLGSGEWQNNGEMTPTSINPADCRVTDVTDPDLCSDAQKRHILHRITRYEVTLTHCLNELNDFEVS